MNINDSRLKLTLRRHLNINIITCTVNCSLKSMAYYQDAEQGSSSLVNTSDKQNTSCVCGGVGGGGGASSKPEM